MMAASSSSDPLSPADIDRLRKAYAAHIDAGGEADAFATERMRPEPGLDFAFIGRTPKRSSSTAYYRCSFCQTDRKFAAGNVVASADGGLRLIGPECWGLHFDTEQYRARKADLQDYEQRVWFVAHRERLGQLVASAIPQVRAVAYAGSDHLRCAASLPGLVAGDTTGFGRLLAQLQRSGGILAVEKYVPDERRGRDEKGKPLGFRPERTPVHRVDGMAAVAAPQDLVREARDAYDELKRAAEAIQEMSGKPEVALAAKDINAVRQALTRAGRLLEGVGARFKECQRFLAPANLQDIVRWSEHPDCEDDMARTMDYRGGTLTVEVDGRMLTLAPTPGFQEVAVPNLDDVLRLLKTG